MQRAGEGVENELARCSSTQYWLHGRDVRGGNNRTSEGCDGRLTVDCDDGRGDARRQKFGALEHSASKAMLTNVPDRSLTLCLCEKRRGNMQ